MQSPDHFLPYTAAYHRPVPFSLKVGHLRVAFHKAREQPPLGRQVGQEQPHCRGTTAALRPLERAKYLIVNSKGEGES